MTGPRNAMGVERICGSGGGISVRDGQPAVENGGSKGDQYADPQGGREGARGLSAWGWSADTRGSGHWHLPITIYPSQPDIVATRFKSPRQAQRFLDAHEQSNTNSRPRRYHFFATSKRSSPLATGGKQLGGALWGRILCSEIERDDWECCVNVRFIALVICDLLRQAGSRCRQWECNPG